MLFIKCLKILINGKFNEPIKNSINNTYIVTIIINSWVKVFKYYKHLNFIFI